jgi:hypothetical protein
VNARVEDGQGFLSRRQRINLIADITQEPLGHQPRLVVGRFDRAADQSEISSRTRLAHSAVSGLEFSEAERPAHPTK